MARRWTVEAMGSQAGRTVLITGATSGIGRAAAIAYAARGARVLLGARAPRRGAAVADEILRRRPEATVEVVELDLAELGSVRRAGARLRDTLPALDALIGNAGVMGTPHQRTADGFELQIGVNHLGHVALVAEVWPLLAAAEDARVVMVASQGHLMADLDVDDLDFERRAYHPERAYGASKLANLLYVAELDRRLRAADAPVSALAAHPGYARTGLSRGLREHDGLAARAAAGVMWLGDRLVAQSAAQGVLPVLCAATSLRARSGEYWGPGGPAGLRGYPSPAVRAPQARDARLAAALWEVSERRVGARLPLPEPGADGGSASSLRRSGDASR